MQLKPICAGLAKKPLLQEKSRAIPWGAAKGYSPFSTMTSHKVLPKKSCLQQKAQQFFHFLMRIWSKLFGSTKQEMQELQKKNQALKKKLEHAKRSKKRSQKKAPKLSKKQIEKGETGKDKEIQELLGRLTAAEEKERVLKKEGNERFMNQFNQVTAGKLALEKEKNKTKELSEKSTRLENNLKTLAGLGIEEQEKLDEEDQGLKVDDSSSSSSEVSSEEEKTKIHFDPKLPPDSAKKKLKTEKFSKVFQISEDE